MKLRKAGGGRAKQGSGSGPAFGEAAKPIQSGSGGGVGQNFPSSSRPISPTPQSVTLPAPVRANIEGKGEER